MGQLVTGSLSIVEVGDTFLLHTDWRGLSALPGAWFQSGFRTMAFHADGATPLFTGFGAFSWGVTLTDEGAPAQVLAPITMMMKWLVPVGSTPGSGAGSLLYGAGAPSFGISSRAVVGENNIGPWWGQAITGPIGAFTPDAEAFITNAGGPATAEVWTASVFYGGRNDALAANEDGGFDHDIDAGAVTGGADSPTTLYLEHSTSYRLQHTLIAFGLIASEAQVKQAWRDYMDFPF